MISYENVILIIIATALISAIISGMYYARRTHRKVSYILDALEDKETNFRFDEKKVLYRRLNKTLNRIRLIFEKEKQEINEQERYYGQMLDRVKTGIVVVELNEKFSGKVSYCNAAALNILGVATLSNIRQLANVRIYANWQMSVWKYRNALKTFPKLTTRCVFLSTTKRDRPHLQYHLPKHHCRERM